MECPRLTALSSPRGLHPGGDEPVQPVHRSHGETDGAINQFRLPTQVQAGSGAGLHTGRNAAVPAARIIRLSYP